MGHTNQQAVAALNAGFEAAFGTKPQQYFSAPGRTEIGGNHTDHQRGRVLAAAVELDTRAAVACNGLRQIRVQSAGYPLCVISLDQLQSDPGEYNTTAALIRGVAARFAQLGCPVEGFDAYVESSVLPGSGLSSSAAFEVLIATVINCLFFEQRLSQVQLAQIAQYAENVYFGKPCGLMDQMASAVGGLVAMDFADPASPKIRKLTVDPADYGYGLCIVDSRGSHADLTDEYAAITREMLQVSRYFGKDVLSQVAEKDFYAAIPQLRKTCGDRAVLRAIHFFEENKRVGKQVQALESGDFDRFLALVNESGRSSYMYLQNVIPAGYTDRQELALTLSLCQKLLAGRGAFRVHGGGFAGTVQAFVPLDMMQRFCEGMDAVLGKGACVTLAVRSQGSVKWFE